MPLSQLCSSHSVTPFQTLKEQRTSLYVSQQERDAMLNQIFGHFYVVTLLAAAVALTWVVLN